MKKPLIKLTKNQIDEKVFRVLQIQQEVKAANEELNKLKLELESQYSLSSDQKEIIYGNETYIEKIPKNNGKNNFNVDTLKTLLKPLRLMSKVIKKTEIVDIDALNSLIKEGKIDETILTASRINKWTHSSRFIRIEKENKVG